MEIMAQVREMRGVRIDLSIFTDGNHSNVKPNWFTAREFFSS